MDHSKNVNQSVVVLDDSVPPGACTVTMSAAEKQQLANGTLMPVPEVDQFRKFIIGWFFHLHHNKVNPDDADPYSYKCEKCDQSTLFYTKPQDPFPQNFCLSSMCLLEMLKARGLDTDQTISDNSSQN